ncbi:regulator [Aeromonas veronii bv. veronii]|nr:regulator [Aeromonas veronii bv. veronii]OKP37392.1 regulator [Aeromonas veronii bv. veronii]
MRRNITKNFIFRWFECGLSPEETAKLCFVSVTEVTLWDEGKPIPPACKRVMRMAVGRELPTVFTRYWDGWRMSGHHLITPAGTYLSRQRLEIIESFGSEDLKALKDNAALRRLPTSER